MRVFLLPESFKENREFKLSGKDYHYLIRVLRFCEGSMFIGRDGNGNLWDLLINNVDHKHKICFLTCKRNKGYTQTGPNILPSIQTLPELHLYQCILKGKKLDTLIRQAVEMGISRFIPIQSAFTVPNLLAKDSQKKLKRWITIRDEALQQSGSSVMTQISSPISFKQFVSHWNTTALGIFFHHEPLGSFSLKDLISNYKKKTGSTTFPVALVIGPEGGFSDSEVTEMKVVGLQPTLLKTNILRAETAALYATACTQMIMSDFDH